MKRIEISGDTGRSSILIGERLHNLKKHIPPENVIIITDENVARYYQKDFPKSEVIIIGTGEDIKTLDTVQYLYQRLLDIEAERSSFIVGIGGGIVCDIVGFAASTYLRGLGFGFVSSTLLAQVDASVGGKNGVNLFGYKNMIGVFNQPEFVICDTHLLETLPEREILCGFSEIVKHAVIADAGFFSYIEKHCERALALDLDVIEQLVYASVGIKSSIVNRDERERGERRKLNFGHTFGHALEKTSGIAHGEAVSLGMVVALELSEKRKILSPDHKLRILTLLERLKLPTHLEFETDKLVEAMKKDKKRQKNTISFVLLHGIGKAIIEEIAIEELRAVINELQDTTQPT